MSERDITLLKNILIAGLLSFAAFYFIGQTIYGFGISVGRERAANSFLTQGCEAFNQRIWKDAWAHQRSLDNER